MNKSYIMLAICLAFFLAGLLFIKYEIDRNRRMLVQDVDHTVQDATHKITDDALAKLDRAWSNGRVREEIKSALTNHPIRALFKLATNEGHRANHRVLEATELTDAEEMEVGRQLDEEILKDMPEVSDPVTLTHLQFLAKGLVSQCQRPGITYHFRIVHSKIVNAFSIAGGYVYVTSAFLDRFHSDGELAMTLGHEIGHVELKHAVHKVQYEYQVTKEFGGHAGSIVQLAYAVLSSPFSKNDEYAADTWGFETCKNAGWKPEQLFVLFEDLDKYEQENKPVETETPTPFERKMGQYFASHPPTPDRLARLKALP